jgi:hypothetical protein
MYRMLGHANLSQTSTDMHPSAMWLQESMRRFDAPPRGKPVANEGQTAHPPLSHENENVEKREKSRLH